MGKTLSATSVLIAGLALLATSSARAAVTLTPLLSLDNPPAQTDKPYGVFFTAKTGTTTTTIYIGGYQKPGFEYVSDISVTLGHGANLLGGVWNFFPAPPGEGDAMTQNDGTNVPALWFGGTSPEDYDRFSQTFTTTPGDTYLLSFNFTNPIATDSSALKVTSTGAFAGIAPSVPEPSTWAMAILGFVGLGLVGYCQRRKTESRTPAA